MFTIERRYKLNTDRVLISRATLPRLSSSGHKTFINKFEQQNTAGGF